MSTQYAIVACLLLAANLFAQVPYYASLKSLDVAEDIPANRGSAAVWQLIQKLRTRASLIMITAHPDDEDGGMLTHQSRGLGARAVLLTLNRGEGGANVMSPDFFDALGLVRTMELLDAGRHYGVDQYWTRVIDYGFSKDRQEALNHWTRDRVLADVVRVVRMTRPLVVTSVFVGGPSDGHGNHQVAGQMAREVFQAAGDPAVFPDQIKAGLRPWSPLKYYARVPFSRRAGGTTTASNVTLPIGDYDPMLGASYVQIARQGLGKQRSQNGGPSTPPAGPQSSLYQRHESRVATTGTEGSFFDGIDTTLAGIATLAPGQDTEFLKTRLATVQSGVDEAAARFDARRPEAIAPLLAVGLRETEAALTEAAASGLDDGAKQDIRHELEIKRAQFNHALAAALGLTIAANVTAAPADANPMMALFRGPPDTFRVAIPGQKFAVRMHVANQSGTPVTIRNASLRAQESEPWELTAKDSTAGLLAARTASDIHFDVRVAGNARFTRPHFTRPGIGQPYYNFTNEPYLHDSLPPYPLEAWAEFEYEGAAFRIGQVVQTTRRVTGLGTVAEPLVVAPAVSVTVQPRIGIVPLGAKTFPVTVSVRSNVKGAASGTVRLELPGGWKSSPPAATFSAPAGDTEHSVRFDVTPGHVESRPYQIKAVAEYDGRQYHEGYRVTGYAGLRPYFLYSSSVLETQGVDVKVAPGLNIGYVTGSGDNVPESLGNLGLKVHFLSAADLASGDLSRHNAVILGVRAYAVRDELKAHNVRLLDYVKNGGVLIVQYNTPEYDNNYGPYPYVMGTAPEEVTDEASKIEILDPSHPIFQSPNRITAADFEGWVEERGSKFLKSWDPRYTALLATNDPGQEPQKGGLLFARYGKGIYIYNAYAFYRQLPSGVPGAYRMIANLLSLGNARR